MALIYGCIDDILVSVMPPSHSDKDHEDPAASWKFDESSGNMDNTEKMQFSSSFYVLARFSLRLTRSH